MILNFLIPTYRSKYTKEPSSTTGKDVIWSESWYQWFWIKFSKNRFIVGYEDSKDD